MDFHGQNTAHGERFLLGFSMYLILTQMDQDLLSLILDTALLFMFLPIALRLPLYMCAGASCTQLWAGRISPISTLHVGPDQSNPRSDPNPNNRNRNPDPITLTRTPTLWGARGRQGQSRGSAECFDGVFSKNAGRPKDPPSYLLTNKNNTTHTLHKRGAVDAP